MLAGHMRPQLTDRRQGDYNSAYPLVSPLVQHTQTQPTVIVIKSDKATVLANGGCNATSQEIALGRHGALPFLKWAGGKQWLSPAALALRPAEFKGRYLEPFVGGGSFFFSLRPAQAVLGDANPELVATYQAVKDDVEGVISVLERYPHTKEFYYRLRQRKPRSVTTRAARMIYLNRTCWNGLYRVNRKGQFNVPFGRYENPTICDAERLRAAARALRSARLVCGDFLESLKGARSGDLVYLDPPYVIGHTGNGFLKYNSRLFSWADQKRLARVARKLADRGVNVLVSNADTPEIVSLYQGFRYYGAVRNSLMAASTESRRSVKEAILSSYALFEKESEVV